MTKYRQIAAGEGILLGLTALFLCFLFALNAWDAGQAVRLAPAGTEASGPSKSVELSAAPPAHAGDRGNAGSGADDSAGAGADEGTGATADDDAGTGADDDAGATADDDAGTGADGGAGAGADEGPRKNADGSAETGIDTDAQENDSVGKLDLNAASVEELETLPGIGPALAERIAEYRVEHGPFPNIEAVTEVSGIGPGKFAVVEPYIFVSN